MLHFLGYKRIFNFSKIAFIGLGNMGMNMAKNLIVNGNHQVYAFDVDMRKQDEAKRYNIKIRKDMKTLTKDAQIFILAVPNSENSKVLCQQECNGIFKNAKKNSLIIDCSTILPKVSIQLHEKAKKHNMMYVDAPVSGGIKGARDGTLNFLIGTDDKKIFSRCKQICSSMGKQFFDCKKPGAGSIIKLCNNLVVGIQMIAVSQALAMGIKLGIDPKVLTEIMKASTSNCWCLQTMNPINGVVQNSPASKNYSQGFYAQLMLKDICYAIETAKTTEIKISLTQQARKMYSKLIQKGIKQKDFGIIYEFILNNKL